MTIQIDPSAKISKLADIEDSVRGSIIAIGPRVVVDSFVKFKPAGGGGNIEIGDDSYINSGCVLYLGNGIKIGKRVLVAANCTLAPTNHQFNDSKKFIAEQGFQPSRGGIIVEDDVWIGANSVILDGAVLAKGCVIGAGSIVREKLEPMTIYAGSPLRPIKKRG